MPQSANEINIVPMLKRIFPDGLAWTGYKKSKLFGLMSKDTKRGGEDWVRVVSLSPTEGGSSNYQDAYANQGPTSEARFAVSHKTEYQLARIKNIAIAKTMGDKGAIVRIVEHTFKRASYAFGRAMARRVWGGGGGMLAQMASTTVTSSTTIALRDSASVAAFHKGMWIQFALDDGTGTSPAGLLSATQLQITAVDKKNKTLTVSAALTTVSANITSTSYIFRAGDYANTMTGMLGWAPVADPTSALFMGVNRTTEPHLLSGYRHAASGKSKEVGLLDACAEGMAHGCEPTHAFWNPIDFNKLKKEVGSDRMIDVKTSNPKVGYKGIVTETALGEIVNMSEVDVPEGYTWVTDPDDWEVATAGECPRILDFDGLGKLVRVQGEDAVQFDLGCYGNISLADGKSPANTIIVSWV